MQTIRQGDSGAAVEDVQQRLVIVGLMPEEAVDGEFGSKTADAVRAFRSQVGLEDGDEIDEKTWSMLVDASYHMGDRTLYLRMPYFHGHDVLELQRALGALGFPSGREDGIFGAFTEDAVRKFQSNLGLPSDGIVGSYTFASIRNLHHSWEGKKSIPMQLNLGFARAADVLESNALCLFGTDEFTRGVASRMSNLSLATNPSSKILSADSLLVKPKTRAYRSNPMSRSPCAWHLLLRQRGATGLRASRLSFPAPRGSMRARSARRSISQSRCSTRCAWRFPSNRLSNRSCAWRFCSDARKSGSTSPRKRCSMTSRSA